MLAHRTVCTRVGSRMCGSPRIRGSRLLRTSGTSSTSSGTAGAKPSPAEGTKTWLSNLFVTYGKVGVATYAGVWFSTISAFFAALQTDALAAGDALQATRRAADAVDSDILRSLATSADEALQAVPSSAGNLAVAFVLTKLCKPLRILATAALTPRMARVWRGVRLR